LIGFVTGLTAEAALVARLGPARAGGGTPAGAKAAADALIDAGVTGLISFGVAGGLNPAMTPGALVIPTFVITETSRYETDATLTRLLGGPAYTLFGGHDVVVTAAEKQRLHVETAADAIDLESGAMAQAAAARGIPFAALRAVCDPASTTLPPAALLALNGQGSIVLARIIAAVLRRPAQIPALLRLGRDAATARRALVRHLGGVTF
jgi:adenosylhomocysteine nucleosidase